MSDYVVSKLDNGLTLVTETVSGVRSVAVGFWVPTGSRYEVGKEAGVSHFIEHMLFKGTTKRSAQDISQAFESLGAELNAFTTKEFTCFYTRLIDEHLPQGVEILSDMLTDPLFKEEHILSERKVVLEEIAMYEDTPDEQVHDLFTQTLWPEHPLGKQVIGSAETVGAFTRAEVSPYFQLHYNPGQTVVAMAGNAGHDEMRELLLSHYKAADGVLPPRDKQSARSTAGAKVFRKDTEQAHVCLGVPCLHANHPDRFGLSVLENIIGGGMSSRLFQKIREERGLAYAIYSYHSLYQDAGCLAVYAGTRPSNLGQVLDLVVAELESIRASGVTRAELIRCRDQIKGQLLLSLESTRQRMTRIGKSLVCGGELLTMDELVKRVEDVDLEQLSRLAAEYLQPDNLVATVIGPVDEDLVTAALAGAGIK